MASEGFTQLKPDRGGVHRVSEFFHPLESSPAVDTVDGQGFGIFRDWRPLLVVVKIVERVIDRHRNRSSGCRKKVILEEIEPVERLLQFRQIDGALRPIVSLATQIMMVGIEIIRHGYSRRRYAERTCRTPRSFQAGYIRRYRGRCRASGPQSRFRRPY